MRKQTVCFLMLALLSVAVAQSDSEDDGAIEDEVVIESTSGDSRESIHYQSPYADPSLFYFADHFDDIEQFVTKWIPSEAKKEDASEEIAKYDGEWSLELPQRKVLQNDMGLVLKSKAKHAAISSRLNRPFTFTDKPLFVQYEVLMQEGQECGGAYLKLLSSGKETTDLKQFQDKTPYTIMFGPDKCGNDIKLHFIFRHVNPKNGTVTEKHCKKSKDRLEEPFKDKQPHLYQLSLYPDNTYKIRVDNKIVNEGSLLTDMTPPVNPPKEIDDPNDRKPEDWDEREKIPDPTSHKPHDWDEDAPPQIPDPNANKPEGWLDNEEEMVPDPNAEKPADWDAEMDGEYEAPLIPNPSCEGAVGCGAWKAPLVSNPDYKGKWRAPLLDNPNYQGKWAPRKILNPEFFEDLHPFRMTPIAAVGFELWTMSGDILFDNLVITDDEVLANEWAEKTFNLKKQQLEKQAESFVSKIKNLVNESPYVVAVVLVVVALPISIIVYFLCSSSKPPPHRSTKKTDTPVPDDELIGETTGRKSVQKNKLDLNAELESDPADQEEDEQDEQETDEPPPAEEKEEVAEEVNTKPNTNESSGTRKRKPRKE